ncbi:hypothetical protein F4776DRAFT_258161 [Hypoxylon sp. NC0597]|nr:hypothetical protein F4776DRAFT_258161 [Hypoxylon sp. NC0597]
MKSNYLLLSWDRLTNNRVGRFIVPDLEALPAGPLPNHTPFVVLASYSCTPTRLAPILWQASPQTYVRFYAALTSLCSAGRGASKVRDLLPSHTETSPSLSGAQPSALCRDIHLPRVLDELYRYPIWA